LPIKKVVFGGVGVGVGFVGVVGFVVCNSLYFFVRSIVFSAVEFATGGAL
jgi:hypothetical protein